MRTQAVTLSFALTQCSIEQSKAPELRAEPGAAPVHVPAPRATPPISTAPRCTLATRYATPHAVSGAAIASIEYAHEAVALDADNRVAVIFRTGTDGRVVARIPVGDGATQAVVDGTGRLFVAAQGAGTVSVYDLRRGHMLCSASVEADPVALALSPDERTLYVATGVTRTLSTIDTDTMQVRATTTLAHEPKSLTIAPDGRRLYATHAKGAPLSVIEVGAQGTMTETTPEIHLPSLTIAVRRRMMVHRRQLDFVSGLSSVRGGMRSHTQVFDHVAQHPSLALASAIDVSGGRVVVPMMINRPQHRAPPELPSHTGYGGAPVSGVDGVVGDTRLTVFALAVWDPNTERWTSTQAPPITPERGGAREVRLPSSIAIDPRNGTIYVASMGTDAVMRVRSVTYRGHTDTRATLLRTLDAPSAVSVTPDGELLVYSQIEHAVELGPPHARRVLRLGSDPLPADVARGRRLFFTADDQRLASSGLSCAGCHPEGRDDGLAWTLQGSVRQTPTLVGRLVAPFNWKGESATLTENIAQTIQRLGGRGVSAEDLTALAAYLTAGLRVPTRSARRLTAHEEHGRVLFHGAAHCGGCHDAENHYTDGHAYTLPHGRFDTPSLRLVGVTAPYFHDGRYPTLAALLADRSHGMGQSAELSDNDRAALEAFLRTL